MTARRHIRLAGLLLALLAAGCTDASEPASGTTAVDATNGDAAGSADSAGSSNDSTAGSKDSRKADITAPCKPWLTPAEWDCPSATHCGYDDDDQIACVPNGEHDVGESCDDGKGCKIGLCVQGQDGEARCSPFCTVASHCQSKSCNGIKDKPYKTCDMADYQPCDPLASNCPGGQACYTLGKHGFVCLLTGDVEAGSVCKASYDCAPGLHCAGAGGVSTSSGLCKPLCKVGGGSPACESLTTPCTPIGGNAGFCDQ